MPKKLNAWLAYLEQLHPLSIDLGLERVRQVAQRLKLPLTSQQRSAQVITFAGTNGKGSTLTLTQAFALAAGHRVGSYTSPHLLRFNERIQLDGQPVEDALIISAFERIEAVRQQDPEKSASAPISLTYFEYTTLAALLIFSETNLDLWLLEVGLGGRLDAVNLVDAEVAVITRIGLDHQAYLGATLEAIAYEKAGIFRPGQAVVLGSPPQPACLLERAKALKCRVVQLGQAFIQEDQGALWTWRGQDAQGHSRLFEDLPWPCLPAANAAVGLEALLMTSLTPPSLQALREALATTKMPGRRQQVGAWLLDVAHNPQATAYLADQLRREAPCRRLALVGMMDDKDHLGSLQPLLSQVSAWMVTALPTPRAASPEHLQKILEAQGAEVLACATEPDGRALYQAARAALEAGHYDQVVVLGSFFTVALFLEQLERPVEQPDTTRPGAR